MDEQEFKALYNEAHRSICPGDETILLFPSGDVTPHSPRALLAAIRDWFGHLAPVRTRITNAQMERIIGPTGDKTSFVFGGSDWRRVATGNPPGAGKRRRKGIADWEKVA